jgi:hypothetical protein
MASSFTPELKQLLLEANCYIESHGKGTHEIGSPLGAVVVGYTEDDRNQVWLSVKPCVLQKALVKLKVPVVSQV